MEAALILQGMESLSSPPRQKTVPRVDHIGDPVSYQDTLLQDPARWPLAIKEELQSHGENGTWTVISRPPGCKPISCKWVFKRKALPDAIRPA